MHQQSLVQDYTITWECITTLWVRGNSFFFLGLCLSKGSAVPLVDIPSCVLRNCGAYITKNGKRGHVDQDVLNICLVAVPAHLESREANDGLVTKTDNVPVGGLVKRNVESRVVSRRSKPRVSSIRMPSCEIKTAAASSMAHHAAVQWTCSSR